MSFDRAKALESAQKYLAKGQLDRAISEYESLVKADPKDSRLLLKLGDLYTRQGATRDASATYRKVAEQYAEQGFFLKAVAVCKQVLKLDPGQIDVWEKLGEMYEMLSLVSDAITTYEQVAEACTRNNNPRKALRAMQKISTLDPENVAARIRYAEALSKLNRPEEAATAFHEGAELLKQQGRIDDYLKVGERLLFHQPNNHAFARELAATYLDRNDAKHALVKLQLCFNAEPKNLDTLMLLARAFEQLGQTAKTVSVLKEVARLHAVEQRASEQGSVLRRILTLEPGDTEARRDLSELRRLPTRDHSSAALDVADDDYDLLLEDDESNLVEEVPVTEQREALDAQAQAKVARLLDECAVFIRYGLTEKMITQLREVLSIDPLHIDAREKLKDAYIKARKPGEAVGQLLALAEQVKAQQPERAKTYLNEAGRIDPANEQVKRSLSTLLLGDPQTTPQPSRVSPEPNTAAIARAAARAAAPAQPARPAQMAPVPSDRPEESFASVMPGANLDRSGRAPAVAAPPPMSVPVIGQHDQDDLYAQDEQTDLDADEHHHVEVDSGAVELLVDDGTALEDDDVVFVEEDADTDADIVTGVETSHHEIDTESDAEIELLAQSIPAPSIAPEPGEPSIIPIAAASIPPLSAASEPAPAHSASLAAEAQHFETPEPLREALEEIEFYLSQEMPEEALSMLNDALASFPGHPLLLARLAELGGTAPKQPSSIPPPLHSVRPVVSERPQAKIPTPPMREDRSFELAQKLAEEVAPVVTTGNTSSAAADVADVLAQFRQGVAKQVDRADAATHYDLGIAYMEMGLHAEAIEEFKLCLVDPTRACTSHTMIGLSYVAKAEMDVGIEHLRLALQEHPRPEEELSLWFELGNAFELMGKNLEALDWYEKAAERDSHFRDVSVRVARLSVARTPEQEADEFDEMFDNMILKD